MAVYVGIQGIQVLVFDDAADGSAAPIRVISGIKTHLENVTDIVLDALGNLYSSQGETNKLVMIAAGAEGNVTPLRNLNGNFTQMHSPQGVAVDSLANVYALNLGVPIPDRNIAVFGPQETGNVPPIRVLTGIQASNGNLHTIAIDRSDNLYLSETLPEIISVLAPGANGSVTPVRRIQGSNTGLLAPKGMDFDNANNLYVSNGANVLVFAPSADADAAPIRTIGGPNSGISNTSDLAVGPSGEVYVCNVVDTFGPDNTILVYAAGADGDVSPVRAIGNPHFDYCGIAIDRSPVRQDDWR